LHPRTLPPSTRLGATRIRDLTFALTQFCGQERRSISEVTALLGLIPNAHPLFEKAVGLSESVFAPAAFSQVFSGASKTIVAWADSENASANSEPTLPQTVDEALWDSASSAVTSEMERRSCPAGTE